MKIDVLITIFLLGLYSCGNNSSIEKEKTSIIESDIYDNRSFEKAYLSLDKSMYDFGEISLNRKQEITVDFEISNIGEVPLVILETKVSCNCLSIDIPKKAIPSGGSEKLTVTINIKSEKGFFHKTIVIKSNAENSVESINIVGNVKS